MGRPGSGWKGGGRRAAKWGAGGCARRKWVTEAVYVNDISDLVIDTSIHGPDEVVALIKARLAEGPGTAFDRIRAS